METIELKVYETTKDFEQAYNYPSWTSKDPDITLNSRHMMLSAKDQAKNFVNGLGRITYFTTVEGKKEISDDEYMFEMITEYVLIKNPLPEINKDDYQLIKVEGHDNAYLGVGVSFGELDRLVYDTDIIIDNLKKQGMTQEEAQEYFNYNIVDAYLGQKMPVYVSKISLEDLNNYNNRLHDFEDQQKVENLIQEAMP
jgi:hypothetical protein